MAGRVPARHRPADAAGRRPRHRRGARPGRLRGRDREVAARRRAGQPGGLADHDRAVPRRRPDPPPRHPARQVPAGGRLAAAGAGARPRRDRRRRPGRRPARADLHGLPPDPVAGCALRADPQAGLRPEHRRRRPGVPDPAPTIAQRIVRAKRTLAAAKVRFELPAGVGAAGPPRRRARGHLPGLQRGPLGHQRRPVVPRRPVRGGAAARPDAGRADARPTPRRWACSR